MALPPPSLVTQTTLSSALMYVQFHTLSPLYLRYHSLTLTKVDLYNFKSHASLGSKVGEGSSSWGWTSPDGREFIAIGQADGAAFAEITKEGKISYLGRLPQYTGSRPAIWREIRGFKNYMVIGSESDKHGIQIFDMKKVCCLQMIDVIFQIGLIMIPAPQREPVKASCLQQREGSHRPFQGSAHWPHSQRRFQ
jgi:hypothetical protein